MTAITPKNGPSFSEDPFVLDGDPVGIRTLDPQLRRLLLYPAELLSQKNGAGDGNRTHITSLEGWRSTTELHPHTLVGAAGLEPATPWSQARCATKLRYAPRTNSIIPK
jgi:hypothetical protein